MSLFDQDREDIQAYRGKERSCENCGEQIYFETRWDEKTGLVTKDGQKPNGLQPPDNNVKWFCMTAISKTEHHCKKKE